jgi:hypothetical protein
VFGLYDQRGMLRYAGPGQADCLAYAELFGLSEDSFVLEPLLAAALSIDPGGLERSAAAV